LKDGPLKVEEILDAAECVLRRFGPAKTTVVDVARALNVSHGTIYRHFPSKADLRDAVTQRWLVRMEEPLTEILRGPGSPSKRLMEWLFALGRLKREKSRADPEVFAMYYALAKEAREVTQAHVEHMIGEIIEILEQGMADGSFRTLDARETARAFLQSTYRFHHPAHAQEWDDPDIDEQHRALLSLMIAGLRS